MGKQNDQAEYWRERNEAWERSGLTQKEWCRREGITRSQFSYHRQQVKKMRRLAEEEMTVEQKSAPAAPVTFVEMPQLQKLQGDCGCSMDNPQQDGRSARLMLQVGSYQLYIKDGFKKQTLASVLEVLANA